MTVTSIFRSEDFKIGFWINSKNNKKKLTSVQNNYESIHSNYYLIELQKWSFWKITFSSETKQYHFLETAINTYYNFKYFLRIHYWRAKIGQIFHIFPNMFSLFGWESMKSFMHGEASNFAKKKFQKIIKNFKYFLKFLERNLIFTFFKKSKKNRTCSLRYWIKPRLHTNCVLHKSVH